MFLALRRFASVAVPIGCVTGCSSDLFHPTDWAPCGDLAGCDETAASSAASTGGAGGSPGGTSSSIATSSASASSAATGGYGGAGGECTTCGEALLGGVDPAQMFCSVSEKLYTLVKDNCACAQNTQLSCAASCALDLCVNLAATAECINCLQGACPAMLAACESDASH